MATRRLTVEFVGDAKRLEQSFGRVAGVGDKLAATGKRLTRGLTLPIVAVGAAAGKLSLDFESSLSKITGLVGVNQKQVREWGDEILDLAPRVGKSPQELADALFFITSAGLKGSDAIDALTESAKASAAGLGETKVVADAVTSALGAYGTKNLSAAKATDILTATVREGKLEADALGGSIGRVLPVASQLGVGFEEVGGAVAVLSRSGASAEQAITGVRGILSKLIKPTEAGKEALAGVGLSFDQIRQSLKERGLLDTLLLLRNRFGDNTEALGKVFEDIEALNAVLAITRGEGKEAAKVFEGVADSAGANQEAFEAWEETTKADLLKAINALKADMIRLGNVLIPLAADVATAVVGAFQKLSDIIGGLPKFAQNALLALVGFGAALGPTLVIVGNLIKVVRALGAAYAFLTARQLVLNAAMLANPIGLLIVGIAALVAAGVLLIKNWDKVKRVLSRVWERIKRVGTRAFEVLRKAAEFGLIGPVPLIIARWGEIRDFLTGVWRRLRDAASDVFNRIRNIVVGVWDRVRDSSVAIWRAIRDVASSVWGRIRDVVVGAVRGARDIAVDVFRKLRDAAKSIFDRIGDIAKRFRDIVVGAFDKLIDAVKTLIGWFKDLLGIVKDVVGVIEDIAGIVGKVGDAVGKLSPFGAGRPVLPPGAFKEGLPSHVSGFEDDAAAFGLSVTSGFRPGDPGFHGLNRARDFAGPASAMLAFAKHMANRFGTALAELIHTPLGFSIDNGQRTAPFAQADHFDHVHVALRRGGLAPGGVALVGETGPELAHLPAGTRVHSARDTEQMLASDVMVFIHGDILSDRRDPVEVVIGDRRFKPAVQQAVRQRTPALPGRGGGRL